MDALNSLVQFTWDAQAASWPFFAIATVTFFVRTVARIRYIDASLGWEDLIISLSWICDVVRMVTLQLALSYTRAVDINNPVNTVPPAIFWSIFTDSWSFISVTLPKVGVAIVLVRIFRPTPWVRLTILWMAFGLFAICVPGFFLSILLCDPPAGQWNPYAHPTAKCLSRNLQIKYSLVGSSTSAFLDFVFAAYPGFVILHLNMPMWKKISTISLMSLGFAAFAFAVVKVANNGSLIGEQNTMELLSKAVKIGLWNSIENDFVLIAACLPSCPAAFKAGKRAVTSTLTSFKTLQDGRSGSEEHSLSRTGQHPGTEDRNIYVRHDVSLGHEEDDMDTKKSAQSRIGIYWGERAP